MAPASGGEDSVSPRWSPATRLTDIPASSTTLSAMNTGQWARTATPMASEGLASTTISRPSTRSSIRA